VRKCGANTQTPTQEENTMEIERSNLIGTTLTDLGTRALGLRGYL
jgi:hypothetical protein